MIKCENGTVEIKGNLIENIVELELLFFQLYALVSKIDKENNYDRADKMYQDLIERFSNVLNIYKIKK